MTELLRGRERRYFGYLRDTTHKIDTPESAKSFRSVMTPVTRKVTRKYEHSKSFKPDPAGRNRFADKIIHQAVQTQIPGLLPPLKNAVQFDELSENPIYLRTPEFEQHQGRSLHYLWLPKKDRGELCHIFGRHLKVKEKTRIRGNLNVKKQAALTGVSAEVAAMEQQEYLESIAKDPRIAKTRQKRLSDIPPRLLRMNRKFQASYWNQNSLKSLPDPFRRARNKTPAFDAICHEHFGVYPEYADIMNCVVEYNKRQQLNLELNADQFELEEAKEQARRLNLFGTLEDEERRRGVKHIKQLSQYDKESEVLWKKQAKIMVSAAEYINKIKAGRRFPTPPKEVREQKKKKNSKVVRTASYDANPSSRGHSSIDLSEYMERPVELPKPVDPAASSHVRVDGQVEEKEKEKRRRSRSKKSKKKRHYHHNYDDDFYMEMYLHFLNPDEDVSLKRAQAQMTDIHELRKKMNLDEDHEKDRKLIELMNSDSVEELHTFGKVRNHHVFNSEEKAHEKEILESHLAQLNNPRMTHMLTKMMSQISLTSDMLRLSSTTLIDSTTKSAEAAEGDETEPPTDSTFTKSPPPLTKPEDMVDDDDDLDLIGDIPENELRVIMSGIDVSANQSDTLLDNLSSESSDNDEEEEGEDEEGGGMAEEIKLFKTVKKKKDSLAEFMDLTAEFRQRVCQVGEGKAQTALNPFAEAVCVLYPDGSDKKTKKKLRGTMSHSQII